MIDNNAHATFPTPAELRLVRLLPGPIERVWSWVVDPAKRVRWLAGGIFEAEPGGRIVFEMHHAKLAPGETPPDKWKHVHDPGVSFEGRVIRCEPPHLLVHTFGGEDSEVTFELSAQDDKVLLVLTHRARGDDLPELCDFASGWHLHVRILLEQLEGTPRAPFWEAQARLHTEYLALRPTASDA
ncbi:SRPBCC family protein [Opitutales bacterium ASA1]|uniref:SRPBCC family protein n=1 Tax=Congregicoccus parvus TaxID=3081749 RepID=UPI002B2AD43E|nr:SRPBCC family protein [Opitutales bacterium ASA1]